MILQSLLVGLQDCKCGPTTDEQRRNFEIWIENLRSGSYIQGNRVLASLQADGETWAYCCLGVATECLALAIHNGVNPINTIMARNYLFNEGNSVTLMAPEAAKEALGLTDEAQNILANANDDGESFANIADTLEAWIA